MRKKVLVTYSVKYCKEIELEVDEETNELLEKRTVIGYANYDSNFLDLEKQPEISDLPIPHLLPIGDNEFKIVEYIDGSFDVESFEIDIR